MSAEARPEAAPSPAGPSPSQPRPPAGAREPTSNDTQSASKAPAAAESSPQTQQPSYADSQSDGRFKPVVPEELDARDQLAAALSGSGADQHSKPARQDAVLASPASVHDSAEGSRMPHASTQQVKVSTQPIEHSASTLQLPDGNAEGAISSSLAGAEQLMSSYLEGQQAARKP